MANYYVSKKAANGDHNVHKEGCPRLPKPENRLFLGYFSSGEGTVEEAKKYYAASDGCCFCAGEKHSP